jgi:glycosyltransferase involved in cell wall biosynthesis
MRIIIVASNFPDEYYPTVASWSKEQADSIFKFTNNSIEVISPKPYIIPMEGFPFYKYKYLPRQEKSDLGYQIHYPQYLYLLPKSFFFGVTGITYSFSVTRYLSTEMSIDKPDIIHARFGYLDGYGSLKYCKKNQIPMVFDVHGHRDFGEYLQRNLIKKFQRQTINIANKIICIAKWQVKKGISIGIPEHKLEYIPLGVDFERFEKTSGSDFSFQRKNEYTQKCVFLFVGSLTKLKGVAYLLQAVSQLRENVKKKCHFIIVGDGPEKNNLQNDVDTLRLSPYITFAGRSIGDELVRLYASADVFVLPSLSEGRPTAINEAMVSGCAIIGSNIDGIPEQVTDGYNGFLVDPACPWQLAEKISLFAEDENLVNIMGKNSKRKILEEGITWQNYAINVSKIYKVILDDQ